MAVRGRKSRRGGAQSSGALIACLKQDGLVTSERVRGQWALNGPMGICQRSFQRFDGRLRRTEQSDLLNSNLPEEDLESCQHGWK